MRISKPKLFSKDYLINAYYQKRRHLFLFLLLPISFLYYLIISIRRFCYRKGILTQQKFSVPVIIVGNITLGGVGKTPLVIWLTQYLQKAGFNPGVVSRGYGGQANRYPVAVTANSSPAEVGDEPILIASHTQCPVIIDPKRTSAVDYLLQNYSCDVVISDDGLQHYALARNIELAVIDGKRGLGNGWLFPAGPLRESKRRLKQVDFIVQNGKGESRAFAMQLIPAQLINLKTKEKIAADFFKSKKVNAIAGIGNPQRFFETLTSLDIEFTPNIFPDHHSFMAKDIKLPLEEHLIMTEKDAVKCLPWATENMWFLPVVAEVDEQLGKEILERIKIYNLKSQ